jgi:membrane-bound lytic murein transglycosylase A
MSALAPAPVVRVTQAFGGAVSSCALVGGGKSSPFLRPENMVHQTMATKINPAPRASSSINSIWRFLGVCGGLAILGSLAACISAPPLPREGPVFPLALPGDTATTAIPAAPKPAPVTLSPALPPTTELLAPAAVINRARSRWVPVAWSEVAGLAQDNLDQAWSAWLKSCERSASLPPALAALCPQVRALSIAGGAQQYAWLQSQMQPYRVESLQGEARGLLTAYFEPLVDASRTPSARYSIPLYAPPPGLGSRKPWYTRQEIDTLPEAQAALQGRALAYVADPVEALILQIQGSGRIRVLQADGSTRTSRLAFAATNEHPYKSVGKWLLDQGLVKDASWPGIKAWLAQNPQRQQELLWSNPRLVFFREEPLSEMDADFGPRGAQGVALTAGRSIAIDPASMPYGTPVWLVSGGAQTQLQKLVIAQDTGSAITGAVRADYFAGWGAQAGELAGRLRQPLQMWVLWPK